MSLHSSSEALSRQASAIEPRRLACIVVTYHPEFKVLSRLIAALPNDATLVIVDNDSGQSTHHDLVELTSSRKRTRLVMNDRNIGLAGAINLGVHKAHDTWRDIQYVLLLDQDSEPHPGSIETLIEHFVALKKEHIKVGCVGPLLLDSTTGLQHGFHQYTHWRWKRTYPQPGSPAPVPCANLNGSGTLVPIDLFLMLGGLDEHLFIDHVDTEWAFRVQASGHALFGIPQAIFEHRMGESCQRIWLFGWRNWPLRSPQRHYYLYRNAIILMRRSYVPRVWKFWAVVKLVITTTVHGLSGTQKREQLRSMYHGVREGLSIQLSHPDDDKKSEH